MPIGLTTSICHEAEIFFSNIIKTIWFAGNCPKINAMVQLTNFLDTYKISNLSNSSWSIKFNSIFLPPRDSMVKFVCSEKPEEQDQSKIVSEKKVIFKVEWKSWSYVHIFSKVLLFFVLGLKWALNDSFFFFLPYFTINKLWLREL